jgi:uncharacterized protein
MSLIPVVLLGAAILGLLRVWRYRRNGIGTGTALGLSAGWRGVGEAGIGMAIAASAVGVTFTVAYATATIEVLAVGPPAPLWNDLLSFVMVPFLEELIFRSALLGGLLVLMPRRVWAAILISAGIFGGLHLENSHATLVSAAGSLLGGVAYGIAFAATQRIWLPFGLHFAWNYVQGPVLGFALSGGKPLRGTLVQQQSIGPAWFTGGEYGPEGGVVGLAGRVVVLLGLYAVFALWRKGSVTSAPGFDGPSRSRSGLMASGRNTCRILTGTGARSMMPLTGRDELGPGTGSTATLSDP